MILKHKFVLFIFGCLLLRGLFALLAKKINKDYLPYLGLIGLIPAIGFLAIHFGFIKRKKGAFNQKIWWQYLRPIHSALYFTFAFLAFQKNKYAYIPLAVDVLIGFCAFLNKHKEK